MVIGHNSMAISKQSWWRHQMETFSALLAICAGNSPVTSEFPSQRPVMRSFDVFFDLRLNKRLSNKSRGWWSEKPSRSLWRHCNYTCGKHVETKWFNNQMVLQFIHYDSEFTIQDILFKESFTILHTLSHTYKMFNQEPIIINKADANIWVYRNVTMIRITVHIGCLKVYRLKILWT